MPTKKTEGGGEPDRKLSLSKPPRRSVILRVVILAALGISLRTTSTKADNDAALTRQNAATQKIAGLCYKPEYRHHHAECGRRVMAQVPVEDRNSTFMDYVDRVLPNLDQMDSWEDKGFALLDRALLDPHVDLKAVMSEKADAYGPPKTEHDRELMRQLAATAMIFLCTNDRYKHHHVECGDRVMAQVPVEDRDSTFMENHDILLVAADRNESEHDKVIALFDRQIRDEKFTRDIKAAASREQMLAVIARYCTGRGELRIGMTELEVTQDTPWCLPASVNETITASGKRRQFIYRADFPGSGGNTGFLYFEDGRLTEIQRHR